MARPVSEIKKDIDKKYKEIKLSTDRLEKAEAKLRSDSKTMSHFAVQDAESKIYSMRRHIEKLRSEMDAIELEAYGTWIPRIRAIKAIDDARVAEMERREEARRVAKNNARNESRIADGQSD